jgi:hypothetical protein
VNFFEPITTGALDAHVIGMKRSAPTKEQRLLSCRRPAADRSPSLFDEERSFMSA